MAGCNLLSFFVAEKDSRTTTAKIPAQCLPTQKNSGFNQAQLNNVTEALTTPAKKATRRVYSAKEKSLIGRYASSHKAADVILHFRSEFPSLNRSMVCKYKQQFLKLQSSSNVEDPEIPIAKRGRNTYLPNDLDADLRKLIATLRECGGVVNPTTIRGCLMGLVKADLAKYGKFLEFHVTSSWLQSLYRRMQFSQRKATTSRPPIGKSAYEEIKLRFHYSIQQEVDRHRIPDELIVTLDQTPSRFFNLNKSTMTKTGESRVPISHCDDKRAITATIVITLTGDILPYQLIYTGTTARCLPKQNLLPKGFLLSFNKTHWSNTEETIKILKNVISPYCVETRKKLGLPTNQKALLIWDDFSAHSAPQVKDLLPQLGICTVDVPKNLTHLLAPLDLTVNRKLKTIERDNCSKYVTDEISKYLVHNSEISDFKLDIRLSVLKPLHARAISESYEHFKTPEGKELIRSGWRASGITSAVERYRQDGIDSRMLIDPFANLRID